MDPQTNVHDLQAKIKGYLEELARDTDLAHKSESMQRYLEFVAKFHRYSPTNIMLILLAKPDATHVMGFNSWKKLNRFVKRGEHGIAIFAPLIHKVDSDDDNSPKVLSGFRIVYVFDISQTIGDPLPETPEWKSPEKNAELTKKLLKFAEIKGIKVNFKDLPGEIQGVSRGKDIEIDPSAGTKTCIHEIAHSCMHKRSDCPLDRATRELEAESVAYVVAKYFGISNFASPNYLALYGATQSAILEKLDVIRSCASEIIKGLLVE